MHRFDPGGGGRRPSCESFRRGSATASFGPRQIRLRKNIAPIRNLRISRGSARRTCMAAAPAPRRGEIWLIDFEPAVGAEIRKARPAVAISVDTVGKLPLRLVVPVTDWKPQYAAYPWFVELPATRANGLAKDSGADAFQVKSVSLS